MWVIPSERERLDLDGPTIEVQPIRSWMVQYEAATLAVRFMAADNAAAEYAALQALHRQFVYEAQPSWEISDHHGPIPATVTGISRLPNDLFIEMFNAWLETLPKPLTSAVDELVPDGELNTEIKRRLKAVS